MAQRARVTHNAGQAACRDRSSVQTVNGIFILDYGERGVARLNLPSVPIRLVRASGYGRFQTPSDLQDGVASWTSMDSKTHGFLSPSVSCGLALKEGCGTCERHNIGVIVWVWGHCPLVKHP